MPPFPPRFADLKREIASSYPDFEKRATKAWAEIIDQLNETTEVITREGSEVRHQLNQISAQRERYPRLLVRSASQVFRASEPWRGRFEQDQEKGCSNHQRHCR